MSCSHLKSYDHFFFFPSLARRRWGIGTGDVAMGWDGASSANIYSPKKAALRESGPQELDWDITGPVASTLAALVFCPAGLSL